MKARPGRRVVGVVVGRPQPPGFRTVVRRLGPLRHARRRVAGFAAAVAGTAAAPHGTDLPPPAWREGMADAAIANRTRSWITAPAFHGESRGGRSDAGLAGAAARTSHAARRRCGGGDAGDDRRDGRAATGEEGGESHRRSGPAPRRGLPGHPTGSGVGNLLRLLLGRGEGLLELLHVLGDLARACSTGMFWAFARAWAALSCAAACWAPSPETAARMAVTAVSFSAAGSDPDSAPDSGLDP